MPEILQKFTVLPVYEITDDINLAPNCVYIIPENKILTAIDGVLKLGPRNVSAKANRPIDIFFKTLADVHQSFALGVVLSGTGFDGTDGLKSIKEAGGITYAQAVDTAHFVAMPQNAIRSGAVDFVLSPEDIPQHLLHIKKAYKLSHAYHNEVQMPQDEEDVFKQIIRVLRMKSDNDFSHYKQPTLRRRIARRMVATKNEEPEAYLHFLRSDNEEQDNLFNDVLIPVSYFFRDPKTFETLATAVFPLLIKDKSPNDSLRLWAAGCSTGEEAYSLAIALHEFLGEKASSFKIQIFASDISKKVVAKARSAVYGKEELQNVSDERLHKYFTKVDGSFQISKVIRDMCVFAEHNFLKDPPFAKIDMISCRNVLIYFDTILQKQAMNIFHYALKPNGILLLGKSETTNSTLFAPLVKSHKIFERKDAIARFSPVPFQPPKVNSADNLEPILKKSTVSLIYRERRIIYCLPISHRPALSLTIITKLSTFMATQVRF